ncbi:MAG TPA: sialidase family protein [Thermoanaerobaculia bacterium]|nr:sialidase family protein [Thermoanaerobaculia bacterium]
MRPSSKPSHRRRSTRNAFLLAAFTLVAALLLATQPGESAPRFSRAEWIEAHELENRFDGGALPARPQDRRPPKRAIAGAQADDKAAAIANPQVSVDLVAPDASAAQPETQAEPFLAIDPRDERRLLAGYQEARFEGGGARALAFAVSTNSGRKWAAGLIPTLTQLTGGPWQRASDPWVAFGPDHRAYFVSLAFDETRPDNAIVVSTSVDGGSSWGDPVTVHRPTGRDFDDKEAIVVDNYADSPFRGRVYVAWDMARDDFAQPLLLSWSEDGGASFAPAVTVKQGVNLGALPLVGPGGVVHLIWGDFSFDTAFDRVQFLAARSDDGGATWSAPIHIDDSLSAGVRGMRTGGNIPAAAVDPRDGTLYVAWQDARFTGSVEQILLSRSTDGGASWSPAEVVSDGPDDAPSFTPAIAVDGSGRVGVAYYSLRQDPARGMGVDLYLAFSTNGGRSFGPSRRISKGTWDAGFAAISRGSFLGDYQGLVAGKKLFHPLFVATYRRSALAGRLQPDVFTATVR